MTPLDNDLVDCSRCHEPKKWYHLDESRVCLPCGTWATSAATKASAGAEAKVQKEEEGSNTLSEPKTKSPWEKILDFVVW